MSIKDVEKIGARQIETLRKKQNREITHMEDGHKALKSEIKNVQAIELVDLQDENHRKVASENDKKEKVLMQMKNHLDNTKNLTDREIKDLKDFSAKFKKEEQQKLSMQRETVKDENELYLDDLNYRFKTAENKVNHEGQTQLNELKHIRSSEFKETDAQFETKIKNQKSEFAEKFQAESQLQQKLTDDLQKQFKNQRAQTNVNQQTEMAKVTTTHNTALEVKDHEFRKGLKVQDEFFEQKYAVNLGKRNEELKSLEDKNVQVLTKMKSELSENLKTTVNRADDPFYKFTQLKPTLKEFEDRVEIKVNVPEHSKADMQLTIHAKEAILNYNRRYDDSHKDQGVLNKLHKVESFTSRVMTSHHLDPKSVKSSYEDGVMTYVVKRA
jgi:HSP20 family molecular chaperone IbpA